MPDPIVVAAGIGVFVSPLAGRALLHGLEAIPQRWRRTAIRILVGAAVLAALTAELWSEGRVKEGVFTFLLGVLPGVFAFVIWRTALASVLLSLIPLYFGVGAQTLGCLAYVVFLRGYPREAIPERDRRLAPLRALGFVGIFGLFVAFLWFLFRTGLVVPER